MFGRYQLTSTSWKVEPRDWIDTTRSRNHHNDPWHPISWALLLSRLRVLCSLTSSRISVWQLQQTLGGSFLYHAISYQDHYRTFLVRVSLYINLYLPRLLDPVDPMPFGDSWRLWKAPTNKNDGEIHPQKICVSGKKNEEETGCIDCLYLYQNTLHHLQGHQTVLNFQAKCLTPSIHTHTSGWFQAGRKSMIHSGPQNPRPTFTWWVRRKGWCLMIIFSKQI